MAYKTKGTRPKNLGSGADYRHPDAEIQKRQEIVDRIGPDSWAGKAFNKELQGSIKVFEDAKMDRNQKALEYIRAKNAALKSSSSELPVVNNEYKVGE